MNAKKLLLVVVVVFLGFWMFTDPSGLADVARNGAGEGWALATDGFRGLIRFLGELF
ncbi:hypothetical protein K8W59_10975 [Nocardioides rotundus]|uniref:hypothetical protein n=1 Tax=Nocardioides rotundus TaxID=1774216 RepID=UPI001CBF5F4A|nr:hypothetical protein [Nocardioides rotundus]UAL28402.1 hypothetical protein K8W59_10975 [Nocardioides rotundus]